MLTTVAAARSAFRIARRAWWPARPPRASRPTALEVAAAFAAASEQFRGDASSAAIAPGLETAALERLLVVVPRLPTRATEIESEGDEPGRTRERHDAAWPPPSQRWTDDEETTGSVDLSFTDAPPFSREATAAEPGGVVALLVDLGGSCRAAAVPNPPREPAELRMAALEALDGPGATTWPLDSPPAWWGGAVAPNLASPAALAGLTIVAAAARRGEPGLHVWPLP